MKKKICLITSSIHMGGMQRAMCSLANQIAERGDCEVTLVALFKLDRFFTLHPDIRFIEPDYTPDKLNVVTRVTDILGRVRREVKRCNPDAVLVYGKYYAALTMLALSGTKYKVFLSDRASPLYRDAPFVEVVTRLVYSLIKPAGVIAQTSISAAHQRKRFGKNVPIEVIPNAVPPISLPDVPKQKQVLAVGRFGDPLKGFDRLIEAWGRVEAPGWRLVFAGGRAEDAPEFVHRATELGVIDRILFCGKVQNMSKLYAESEIFVIPSRSEGFPNALAEAMVAGLACVSFDFTSGPRDIITHEVDGIIVPNGDIDALASAINRLIDTPLLRERLARQAPLLAAKVAPWQVAEKTLKFMFNQ